MLPVVIMDAIRVVENEALSARPNAQVILHRERTRGEGRFVSFRRSVSVQLRSLADALEPQREAPVTVGAPNNCG